jgi:hypothetical protein
VFTDKWQGNAGIIKRVEFEDGSTYGTLNFVHVTHDAVNKQDAGVTWPLRCGRLTSEVNPVPAPVAVRFWIISNTNIGVADSAGWFLVHV